MLSDLGCPHLLLKLADHTGELQNWHPRRPFLHHVGFQAPPGAPSIFNYFSPFFEAFFVHAVYAASNGTGWPSPYRLFAVCLLRLAHPSLASQRDTWEHGSTYKLAVFPLWKSPGVLGHMNKQRPCLQQ